MVTLDLLLLLGGGSISLLLLVSLLVALGLDLGGQQSEDLLVLDLLLGLDGLKVNRGRGDTKGTGGHDADSEQELSNKLALLLLHDVVGGHDVVLGALQKSHAGLALVLHLAKVEGELTKLLGDLGQDNTGSLHLQAVVDSSLLVDGGARGVVLDLTLTGRDHDINAVDLVLGEGALLKVLALALGGVQDDLLLAVNDVLLLLVRQHALDGLAAVGGGNAANVVGHGGVGVTGADQADGGLGSLVGSHEDIGLLAGDGVLLRGTDNNGGGGNGAITIDLGTELDLDHVAGLEDLGGLGGERGEVADGVVDRDAGGETNTLMVPIAKEKRQQLESGVAFSKE